MMKKVFFVTGCIASGKSKFMQIARSKGFETISADEVAHQILDENGAQIAKILGDDSFLQNGTTDRKALGKLIFANKNLRQKLENFMHPKIHSIIVEWIKSQKGVVFAEIPLFFESGAYANLGEVVLIYAPKELCLKRLMRRNALSESEANLRLNSQMDIEQKRALADIVIENCGLAQEFEEKCEEFLAKLGA